MKAFTFLIFLMTIANSQPQNNNQAISFTSTHPSLQSISDDKEQVQEERKIMGNPFERHNISKSKKSSFYDPRGKRSPQYHKRGKRGYSIGSKNKQFSYLSLKEIIALTFVIAFGLLLVLVFILRKLKKKSEQFSIQNQSEMQSSQIIGEQRQKNMNSSEIEVFIEQNNEKKIVN